MPTSLHPQAKFDPIPPDLDLHSLVERTPHFQWVTRITAAQIRNIGPQEFEKLVFLRVIQHGKPLVIEKWNDRLPKSLFGPQYLETHYNKKQENVRDIVSQTDIPMTMGHYLRSMKQLTNQWTPTNFRDERRQRLYLKDIDCPPEWQERLSKVIPPNLFYMNENIDERGGKRQTEDLDMFQETHSAAPAGDLMSSLPEQMRAQNLMCYIGHEGTYTPAHREMCASLGQNIMVDASGDENGEKPGSSIWFMTETKDREVVREFFLSMLGHDIEIEKHFAQINAWKKANFPVYIVEQKVGDFILVPPLAPHQVWNRGTRTVKVAWNRTTVETLDLALHEALPKARLVCRDEQYKNKAIIFFTLQKYYQQMTDMEKNAEIGLLGFGHDLIKNSTRMKQMAADFKHLFRLYTEILIDEMFATKEKDVEYVEFDSCITCSYCRANIFNRFLTCKHCVRQLVNGDEDTYDVCMECYAMGRSCLCVSNLSWCEQWKWSDLVDRYEEWRSLIIKNDGFIDLAVSPLPIEIARRKTGKKSVAQICQEQLRRRPWKDISKVDKPLEPEHSEPEVDVDDNGRPIKKKKKGRKRKLGDVYRCHVCNHKDYTHRLAFCSNHGCTDAYCFGVLYRAFDMMPQEVLQNERWECPKCLKMCNCGACRKGNSMNPYIPKNTLLGHDTRPIADDRSVESLVDFRVHNLSWLKNVGDESRSMSSTRIQRLQQAAESEKAKEADSEVPVLPDKELAERLETALRQEDGHAHEHANGTHEHAPDYGEPGRAEVADPSVGSDQSQYPDPSTLGNERMLGMGYYEQDDSPDKILFDPYEKPTAEALVVDDEPEESEYLKKQLRLAKRRARNEEDNDPDFAAPKSHHRKRHKVGALTQDGAQQDALDNMDPALFGDTTMLDAPAEPTTCAEPEEAAPSVHPALAAAIDAEADGSAEPAEQDGHRPYSPNRPTLRHARPKVSYLLDQPEEEFDEVMIPRSKRPPEGITNFNPENVNKDPLDLASAAIFTMNTAGTSALHDPTAAPPPNKPGRKPGGQPGRPPGNPRVSNVSQAQTSQTPEVENPPKRRGRPPRSARPSAVANTEEPSNIDAQFAQQLEGFDDNGEYIGDNTPPVPQPTAPKRRGRPPRSSLVQQPVRRSESAEPEQPVSMSMAERMQPKGKKNIKISGRRSAVQKSIESPDPESTSPATKAPTPRAPTPEPAPRPATRPRGRPAQTTTESSNDVDFDPAGEEEEISSRASSSSASPSTAKGYDQHDEMFVDQASPSAASPSRSPSRSPSPKPPARRGPAPAPRAKPSAPPERQVVSAPQPISPPKPAGPTIVRLMDLSEDESWYGPGDEQSRSASEASGQMSGRGSLPSDGPASSSDSDSDIEDIPARKNAPVRGSGLAIRGRGSAVRGRGRGRGRGRRGAR
ncbi:hypothetical protein OQA88_2003 [Cercophora sp. LCS_1]